MNFQFSIFNFQKKVIFFLILTSLFLILAAPAVQAQVSSIGIAQHVEIAGNKIEDGDIVTAKAKGFAISTQEYDPEVFGVVSLKAGIEIKSTTDKKTYPVVTSGTVLVKVSNVNGDIKKGEFITTSNILGTGMKATRAGFVIGQSLEDVTFGNNKTLVVPVILNMHTLQGGAFNLFNLTQIATYEAPTKVIQYIVAAIIAMTSFGIGFFIFAKAVNTGLEAIGRNPLASRTILFSIAFNLVLIIVIITAGTALAYLVIRL